MLLILGLGNPGPAYRGSRHNVGFACLELLSRNAGIRLGNKAERVIWGRGKIGQRDVVLAKPRTYMNASGEALTYLLARFSSNTNDILIIHDDMDITLGSIRLRPKGGDAGHKGLKSIISSLGTQDFIRVRIGIDRPVDSIEEIGFVLGQFSPNEVPIIEHAIKRAVESIECLVAHDIDTAMNLYNGDESAI